MSYPLIRSKSEVFFPKAGINNNNNNNNINPDEVPNSSRRVSLEEKLQLDFDKNTFKSIKHTIANKVTNLTEGFIQALKEGETLEGSKYYGVVSYEKTKKYNPFKAKFVSRDVKKLTFIKASDSVPVNYAFKISETFEQMDSLKQEIIYYKSGLKIKYKNINELTTPEKSFIDQCINNQNIKYLKELKTHMYYENILAGTFTSDMIIHSSIQGLNL